MTNEKSSDPDNPEFFNKIMNVQNLSADEAFQLFSGYEIFEVISYIASANSLDYTKREDYWSFLQTQYAKIKAVLPIARSINLLCNLQQHIKGNMQDSANSNCKEFVNYIIYSILDNSNLKFLQAITLLITLVENKILTEEVFPLLLYKVFSVPNCSLEFINNIVLDSPQFDSKHKNLTYRAIEQSGFRAEQIEHLQRSSFVSCAEATKLYWSHFGTENIILEGVL